MIIGSSVQSCFVTAIALSVGEGAICYHITHSTTETATLLLKRNCCENCRSYINLLNKIIAVVMHMGDICLFISFSIVCNTCRPFGHRQTLEVYLTF